MVLSSLLEALKEIIYSSLIYLHQCLRLQKLFPCFFEGLIFSQLDNRNKLFFLIISWINSMERGNSEESQRIVCKRLSHRKNVKPCHNLYMPVPNQWLLFVVVYHICLVHISGCQFSYFKLFDIYHFGTFYNLLCGMCFDHN